MSQRTFPHGEFCPLLRRTFMSKSAKYSRTPSPVEVSNYNGMHCASMYREALAADWRCPCCRRSAPEIIRWTEIRGPTWRARFADEYGMGFTAPLTKHHCHGGGRFHRTVICGDCNSADGAAKRKLKLPDSWSYSPAELSRFVSVPAHSGKTSIDYDIARLIYESQMVTASFWRT